jgi:hypothetical protein
MNGLNVNPMIFAAFSPISKRAEFGLCIFWSVAVMLVDNINLLPLSNLRSVSFFVYQE